MKSILVPIDFSKSSDYIIEEAVEFAKSAHAKIYLLHVASLDLGFVIGDTGFQYMPELEAAGMKSETDELSKYEEKIKQENLDVEIFIKQGIPSEVVLQTADEKDIDIIVMGSHGRGFFMEAILGSVSRGVIKGAKIPVLIIPREKLRKNNKGK
ncbi:MAG: universal stress protein [Flavobacteriaceae bacterium]|jgi:nucleotide-binding universal stress UspA family protein|nr:universal stress protein [Flavobacteriaceae bacterium]